MLNILYQKNLKKYIKNLELFLFFKIKRLIEKKKSDLLAYNKENSI